VIPDRRAFWRAWIPTVIWLGVIAVESTDWLSSQHTSRFLYPIFHVLFGIAAERFELWHFVIRKTGHVLGYGILSVLLFRAWRVTVSMEDNPAWSRMWAGLSFFLTVMVASLDEWHQTFIPSRTGSFHDVLLDSAAALIAQLVLVVWIGKKSNRRSGILSDA
jgi:VanZ family protein